MLAVPTGTEGADTDEEGQVWMWVGKEAGDGVVATGMTEAEAMLSKANSSRCRAGSLVHKVMDGWEPSVFRAAFVDWLTPCGTSMSKGARAQNVVAFDAVKLADKAGAVLGGGGAAGRGASLTRKGSPVEGAEAEGACLVRLRGRKFVTAVEVPFTAESINGDDVFVLSIPSSFAERPCVVQRNGRRVSMVAKAVAAELAAAFVQQHAGRASHSILDTDDDDSAAGLVFWNAIGAPRPAVLCGIDEGEEAEFEARARKDMRLLRLGGDGSGDASLVIAGVSCDVVAHPWRQEVLGPQDVCVLHWPRQQLWVWSGNRAPVERKQQGFEVAAALQRNDPNTNLRPAPQVRTPNPPKRLFEQSLNVA